MVRGVIDNLIDEGIAEMKEKAEEAKRLGYLGLIDIMERGLDLRNYEEVWPGLYWYRMRRVH